MELKHPERAEEEISKVKPIIFIFPFMLSLSSYYRSKFIIEHQPIFMVFP